MLRQNKGNTMGTLLKIHGTPANPKHIENAAQALSRGKIILAPTETGYCFFGDAAKDQSYESLLNLRHAHPKTKPFSIVCSSLKQISEIAFLPTPIFRDASRSFPGPYTFVLQANKHTPQHGKGTQRKTVGVRMSGHPIASALAIEFGKPMVVTSVTDAEELIQDNYYEDIQTPDSWWVNPDQILQKFVGKIDVALDWIEFVPLRVSTVIDYTSGEPVMVRDGGWGD
jgi:tRNA threonylcarbamoyl adenosine modification protein (Sua5/YciO/YrdC/YwlC family)